MQPDLNEILDHAKKLLQKGNNSDAWMLLVEVVNYDPKNRAALMMLAGSNFNAGNYAESSKWFAKLVGLEPGAGKSSVALFNSLWKQGEKDMAMAEIKRFIATADKAKERATIEQYLDIVEKFGRSSGDD
ncbi:tetratricopeptide repeat protein [Porticoccus sp. GXU_MW_L64]